MKSDPIFDADLLGGTTAPEKNGDPVKNEQANAAHTSPAILQTAKHTAPSAEDTAAKAITESTTCLIEEAKRLLAQKVPEIPPIDKDRIKRAVMSDQPTAAADVREFHEARWLERFGEMFQAAEAIAATMQFNKAGLEYLLDRLRTSLRDTATHFDLAGDKSEGENKSPWTLWDRLNTLALFLITLALIPMEMNTLAQFLYASGVPGFDNWTRCYLFSAIPLVVPVILETSAKLFRSRADRNFYTGVICSVGVAMALLWYLLFSRTFNGLTMTGADIIKGVLSGGATAPQDGAWLVFVSLVAQSCLAAGALLLIEFIVAKHRCVRDDNPAYLKTQKQTNAILRVLERQAAVLGQLEGRVQSLQKGRDSYLKDADDTLNMGRNFLG